MVGSFVNDKLESMWKEVVVAKINTLIRHLPGGSKDSQPQGRDLNPGPPEYEPFNYEHRLFERDVLWERNMTVCDV
jgi:hypothetical protein